MAANDSVSRSVANGQPNINTKRVTSAASTNATSVKSSGGKVHGWSFYNAAAYAVFVKFYDKASAPTVGTDTPVLVVGIKAGERADLVFSGEYAPDFDNGIALAVTKLGTDADTTAVAANDVEGAVYWR